jgi:AAA15 family ATPase/GTPase
MIKKFEIENYKSIKKTSIELGRFNIFIGENGCGKSNILEAFAMFSTSISRSTISTDEFYNKVIRVSNPKLTFN